VQERCKQGSVSRLEAGLVRCRLAVQDGDLVAEGEDFNVLVVVAHRQ
jgi:hypothetical protein